MRLGIDKRHPRPAPIIDTEPHRDVGLGSAVAGDTGFLPISFDRLTPEFTHSILPTHRVAPHLRVIERMYGFQHFVLFGADRVGVEGVRWLHRGQAEELEDVVWYHVAQRTGRLVEPRTQLYADCFRHGDLHMIDVVETVGVELRARF